ncbi:MAG: choice-of-anchor D domain-containing protein [Terracidiphilus sp.]|jgi:hypothetical protein
MKGRLLLPLSFVLIAMLCPLHALADSVDLGFVSYDVTGTNIAEFDIFNLTGPNSFDPDFPSATAVSFSDLSLVVDYSGGQTATFGSSYFTLSSDGLSFNGNALSTLEGSPNGLNGAISATLSGMVDPVFLTLDDGEKVQVGTNFSATISDASGLTDGDSAVIEDAVSPEPGALVLVGTGLLALYLMRRRFLPGRYKSIGVAIGLGCVFVMAGLQASMAQSVSLSAWTAPNSGAAGITAVNITGSGFPSGTIPATNVSLSVASSCAGSGAMAAVNSVTKIIASTERVQFVIPGSLATGSYFVSLSGTTSGGTAFSSVNCAEVNVTGAAPTAVLSSSSIIFSGLAAGTAYPAQTVNLTNTGTAVLNISGISLSGTGVNIFSESNNCPPSLAVGGYCTITTGFNPLVPGTYSAMITVTDNASPGSQSYSLSGTATPFAITIDTTNATDWLIKNGALTLDFNPSKGRIFGIHLAGFADNLVDATSSNEGIYMDNSGLGTGTITPGYVNAGSYLDWWVTTASNATNAYTYSMHFVVFPNDPGIHTYFVANHATTDIAGGIGQVQWVYRSNLNDFTNTYSVNADLSNPGPVIVPLPPVSESFSTDPGRAVSDATVDLHGFTLPAGFTREFYTKYDYSSYNYLHQAHGTFGSTFGVWGYFPSNESLVGGPTKQNLIYTGNLLILEAYSNHYDNELALKTAAGVASSRLFGPFYIHFNTIGPSYTSTGTAINTPDDMYADALQAGASFIPLYDTEQQLLQSGYVPSTARGSVSIQVGGVIGAPKTAWAVLSDPGTNIQLSSQGYQYWADISATGSTTFTGVVPGTYRLSVYDLGQFGELRQDGIVVTANSTTTVPAVTFVPENFGGETVFTIGTPDRSSHEFLHGHDSAGHDDREFFGTWNYWADFAANNGSVVYNATAGPAGPATNDLNQWNYDHWGVFDPGLFGGVYNSTDDTTDGYKYAIPAYVATLTGAAGTNGVTTRTPVWKVHFATPADAANYEFAVLSIAMACDFGSYVVDLNGTSSTQARTWGYSNTTESDCAVRSGLSGYTQWIAFQFPIVALNPAGQDNVMTLGVSQTYGVMDDALRLELSNTGAAPSVTGWNDYEYVSTNSTANNIHANDAVPNP